MQQDSSKWLWSEWALATLIGYVTGTLLALLVVFPLAYAALPGWGANAAGGAVVAGATTAMQWLVLRRSSLGRSSRSIGLWWLFAGLLGGMAGMALDDLLAVDRAAAARLLVWSAALPAAVSGLLFGLSLGGAQWCALHLPARTGIWWLFANGLGWTLGLALGAVAALPVSVIGGLLTSGAVTGVITGVAFQHCVWPVANHQAGIGA